MSEQKKERETIKEQELKRIKKFYNDYIFPLYDHAWKRYMKDSSLRERYIKDWQTNIFTATTQKIVDVMYASIYNAKMGYDVKGRNKEGINSQIATRDLLDYFFEIAGGRDVLQTASFETFVCGKSYIKTFWHEEKEVVKRVRDGVSKSYTLKDEKNPSMRTVSSYNVLVDPVAESIESARFVYELDYLTMSQAYKKYKNVLSDFLGSDSIISKKEFINFIEKSTNDKEKKIINGDDSKRRQPKTNPSHIKQRVMMSQAARSRLLNSEITTSFLSGTAGNQTIPTPDSISIEFEKGTFEFAERWTNDKFTLFRDGKELFTIDNPLSFRGVPFNEIYFKQVPLTVFGIGIPYAVSDVQDLSNILWNLKIDSAKIYGVPSFTRKRTSPGELYDGDSTLEVSPGKVFSVTEENELKPLISSGHASNIQMLREEIQDLDREAKEAVGVNEYILGSQGKVERSAAAVKTLVQSFNIRLKPFISSLNLAMSDIAKKWMIMVIALGTDKYVIPTVDSNGMNDVRSITIDQIVGQHLFSFQMESLASLNRDLEKERFVEILPVLQNYLFNPKTGEPIVDVVKVVKNILEKFEIPVESVLKDGLSKDDSEKIMSSIEESLIAGGQLPPQIPAGNIKTDQEAAPSLPGDVPGQL